MATVQELARHLEKHPDDHPMRWRLAKKQYMACEYRDALSNLMTLRREWARKQNVSRYLAATYYRLGQYTDAIRELEEAIVEWPSELSLREQLARVYEAAGQREEAADVWEAILLISATHPLAARAIERLRQSSDDRARADLHLHDSDSGINLRPVVMCAGCGAQNSEEFERCWQCHAPLMLESFVKPHSFEADERPTSSQALSILRGLAMVAAATVAVYMSVRYVLPELTTVKGTVSTSVSELILRGLAVPRGAMGLVLAIVWPAMIGVTLRMTKAPAHDARRPVLTGVFFAAAVYCLSWLPVFAAPMAMGAAGLCAIALSPYLLYLPVARGMLMGAIHTVLSLAAGLAAFGFLAGTAPLREFDAIAQYAHVHRQAESQARYEPVAGATRFTLDVTFDSTGSAYLDELASTFAFEVTGSVTSPPLLVEFRDDTSLLTIADVTAPTVTLVTTVRPNQSYRLIVSGQEGIPVTIRPRGVLRPSFTS